MYVRKSYYTYAWLNTITICALTLIKRGKYMPASERTILYYGMGREGKISKPHPKNVRMRKAFWVLGYSVPTLKALKGSSKGKGRRRLLGVLQSITSTLLLIVYEYDTVHAIAALCVP